MNDYITEQSKNLKIMLDEKKPTPILINFCGKSGSGKSAISRTIAAKFQAVYLEMDTIEWLLGDTPPNMVNRYEVAYGLAKSNLLIGNPVVSDACNHSKTTRKGWNQIAEETGCIHLNIEITCSDNTQRKARLEERKTKMKHILDYDTDAIMSEPWDDWDNPTNLITIDTADRSINECISLITNAIRRKLNP